MVCKETLKWATVVAVEPNELYSLPEATRAAIKGKAGVTPKVLVSNPSLSESYAILNHEEMKSKAWSTIFQKAKADVSKAKAAGNFLAPEKVVKAKEGEIRKWKSASGSEIEARFIALENDEIFVFKRADGSQIRALANQLDEASVVAARALLPAE